MDRLNDVKRAMGNVGCRKDRKRRDTVSLRHHRPVVRKLSSSSQCICELALCSHCSGLRVSLMEENELVFFGTGLATCHSHYHSAYGVTR